MKVSAQTEAGIDFLRGVFAILVLLGHSVELARLASPAGSLQGMGYTLVCPGGFWVGGFFVLSGFCIGNSILRSLNKGEFSEKKYLFQRLTRIAPIYYCALGLALLAWALDSGGIFPSWKFGVTLIGMQNFFFESLFPHFGASWSITNELFYYFTLPILVYLGGRSYDRVFWIGLTTYAIMTLSAALAWLLLGRPNYLIPLWTIPWNGIAWMIGFGGVLFGERILAARVSQGNHRILILALTILLLGFCHRTWALLSGAKAFAALIVAPVIGIGFTLLILSLHHIPRLATPRIMVFFKWLGLLSYPLYLFHQPIQGCLNALMNSSEFNLSPEATLGVFFIGPLVLSSLIGVYLERRFLDWRKHWLKKRFPSPNGAHF